MTHAPNVLLLDQDPVLRRATALLLANRGAGVSPAATLDEAIDLCRARAHDLALIDLDPLLPGADEVIRRLREDAIAPSRIVVCSALPIDRGDADELLRKPYPFDRLMQLVFGRTTGALSTGGRRGAGRLVRTKSPLWSESRRGRRPLRSPRRGARARRRPGGRPGGARRR